MAGLLSRREPARELVQVAVLLSRREPARELVQVAGRLWVSMGQVVARKGCLL